MKISKWKDYLKHPENIKPSEYLTNFRKAFKYLQSSIKDDLNADSLHWNINNWTPTGIVFYLISSPDIFISFSLLCQFFLLQRVTGNKTIEEGSIFYWGYYASLSLFEYTTKGHLFWVLSLSQKGDVYILNPFYATVPSSLKKHKHKLKQNILLNSVSSLILIRLAINSFSSQNAERFRDMTNVKLIIYLSQSQTPPLIITKQTFYLFTSRNSFMS